MDKQDLTKLRLLLPKKYTKQIALKCNLSESYIRKVLSGNADRLDVIDYAIVMAEEHQEEMSLRSTKIESL